MSSVGVLLAMPALAADDGTTSTNASTGGRVLAGAELTPMWGEHPPEATDAVLARWHPMRAD
jgi:hypothetical protein